MMKMFFKVGIFALLIVLLPACKSEFEKIRVSGDTEQLYKKAFEYYEAEEFQKAHTLFELLLGNLRGKVEAEKVYFYYAYSQYFMGKYILASYYFKDFSTKFLNSQFKEEADFMTAYSQYKLSPSYRLDQTYTQKAVEGMQLFVNTYPQSERVAECNKLIDEMRAKMEKKAYEEADLYFSLKQYQASIQSFENLLKDFPETTNAEKVRFRIIEASYLFAQNSIVDKQNERYKETMALYDKFVGKYPKSKFKKDLNTIRKTSKKKIRSLKDFYKSNKKT